MQPLYDVIGKTYSRSRQADSGIVKTLSQTLGLLPSGVYLDLACGTGNYTVALSGLGGKWSAIDVSTVMLMQAREKDNSVSWIQSSADALPFPDGCFDGAICTLAIHHFSDLRRPFAEVYRTLRGGKFVLFTGLAEQMRNYWLCHYFPEMMALSIANMPTETKICEALLEAGFKSVTVEPFFVTNELQDQFLYSGKHRPSLYLDPAVRANISSFARLSSEFEIQIGLDRLSADIQSGAFPSIAATYAIELGDYAYIQCTR
jgi:ubiquinone/menaquinone biosynthesis C-methylase UbiE